MMDLFLSDGVHEAGNLFVENELEPSSLGGVSPRKGKAANESPAMMNRSPDGGSDKDSMKISMPKCKQF